MLFGGLPCYYSTAGRRMLHEFLLMVNLMLTCKFIHVLKNIFVNCLFLFAGKGGRWGSEVRVRVRLPSEEGYVRVLPQHRRWKPHCRLPPMSGEVPRCGPLDGGLAPRPQRSRLGLLLC